MQSTGKYYLSAKKKKKPEQKPSGVGVGWGDRMVVGISHHTVADWHDHHTYTYIHTYTIPRVHNADPDCALQEPEFCTNMGNLILHNYFLFASSSLASLNILVAGKTA